jgi:adenine-specific DNA-methyltransferase
MPKKPANEKQIESFVHEDASRRNIPPAEFQTMVRNQEKTPIQVSYERRNPDLDPQLIWRGKDLLDESPLVVNAPPLYIQEKIHPKVLIDDLKRRSKEGSGSQTGSVEQIGLFDTIKGDVSEGAKTEFYQHDQNWSNRMILGDSLQVMASLAEREGLRGKVQCIYFDPPYGIKFNSNFQWSTTSRDVKDGKPDQITREPEQVKAFRDTWRDGVHSYLEYLRQRMLLARELLSESGSIFVQIGDENVHRVRSVMDEVMGDENFVAQIAFQKTSSSSSDELSQVFDYILWYSKVPQPKYRPLFLLKSPGDEGATQYTFAQDKRGERKPLGQWPTGCVDLNIFAHGDITSQRPAQGEDVREFEHEGRIFHTRKGTFKTDLKGLSKLSLSQRLIWIGNTLRYVPPRQESCPLGLTHPPGA